MAKTSAITIIRRGLATVVMCMSLGTSHAEVYPPSIEVQEVVEEVVPVTQVIPEESDPIGDLIKTLGDQNHKEEASDPLLGIISTRFKVPSATVKEIITLATRYAYPEFPKRNDILAIIAVESRYNTKAYLQGCFGLMQIQKKAHLGKLTGRSLSNPQVNIEIGSFILNQYYLLLGKSRRGAILAYNAGIGSYLKGRYNSMYYTKYSSQLRYLSN